MDDPFFAPAGDVCEPVEARKTLKREVKGETTKNKQKDVQQRPKVYENKRLPSMLNDVEAPKPLKIYPNKPPNSRKLFIDVPDTWNFAEPYDD